MISLRSYNKINDRYIDLMMLYILFFNNFLFVIIYIICIICNNFFLIICNPIIALHINLSRINFAIRKISKKKITHFKARIEFLVSD